MHGSIFIFGLGYTAGRLAANLVAAGWTVRGTVRSTGPDAPRMSGIQTLVFDGTRPGTGVAEALASADHLLVSVPPDRDGDPVLRHHRADIAAAGQGRLRWIGYLSTTGVYGDRGGDWVDEECALSPSGARGARRVAAERDWAELGSEMGVPVHLFRLAGIYGPGRNQLETVRAGTARRLDKPGQVFSRIHVDDAVRVLHASMAHPASVTAGGTAYNVCDDRPAAPGQVVAHAAALLGVDPPPIEPFETANLSPMARSFYDDNKRVRNDRIKRELGVTLRYPDYEAGLAALLPTVGNAER